MFNDAFMISPLQVISCITFTKERISARFYHPKRNVKRYSASVTAQH